MTVDPDFTELIVRSGVGFPRGVLGPEARALASAILAGADDSRLHELRVATAAAHWDALRLAMGAGLERAGAEGAVADRAAALVLDSDPGNPLALALAEDAARGLAAMIARNGERLQVMEGRLASGGSGEGELALTVGEIVADLLDLDHSDYEDEIAAYVGSGETDGARRELARATGDDDSRLWAREELRAVDDPDAPAASGAVRMLAAGDPPEDPAEDAVWVAATLALVEQAIELTVVRDHPESEGDDG